MPDDNQEAGEQNTCPLALAQTVGSEEGDSITIGNPKGTLSISIIEGQELRPSLDPYVICQFQCSEDISPTPKKDADAKNSP